MTYSFSILFLNKYNFNYYKPKYILLILDFNYYLNNKIYLSFLVEGVEHYLKYNLSH